jgi:sporulation protein YlmC with PRC-barrel domain
MTPTETTTLMRLADRGLTVADPAEDVRGRGVVDRDGEEIGEVRALLVDGREEKVLFLEVESGGFLGVGRETRLLPVDAVTRVEEHAVHVDQTREAVHGSPPYDPELREAGPYLSEVYGYYGYAPFWTAGHPRPPQR